MNKMGKVDGKLTRTSILLSAGIILALSLTACNAGSRGPTTARANAPQTVPVTVSPVLTEDFPIYLGGLGSIQA
jgi:hypothetical protein